MNASPCLISDSPHIVVKRHEDVPRDVGQVLSWRKATQALCPKHPISPHFSSSHGGDDSVFTLYEMQLHLVGVEDGGRWCLSLLAPPLVARRGAAFVKSLL